MTYDASPFEDNTDTAGVRPPERCRGVISYAQNGEDVRLARALGDRSPGRYIDVGAHDPTHLSITRHFYDAGWSGINIEASPRCHAALVAGRARDVNLHAAASNRIGTITFYEAHGVEAGLSTAAREVAETYRRRGVVLRERRVPATTLEQICVEHAVDAIDFLTIDVEGHEREVLEGADFTRFRPLIVIVEATWPLTPEPTHEAWEPLLLTNDYLFAAFDGLNRFYVRGSDRALLPLIARPVSSVDQYITFDHWQALEALKRDRDRVRAESPALVRAAWQIETFRARVAASVAWRARRLWSKLPGS